MVITDGFLRQVREETVRVKRTATLRFDAHGVILADGTRCDVDAIVMCTGYTTALPLLEQSVLTALEFDLDYRLQPTLLHRQVFHLVLPGLAFVGHYRGLYFPVMELQSRWIVGILAGEIAPRPHRRCTSGSRMSAAFEPRDRGLRMVTLSGWPMAWRARWAFCRRCPSVIPCTRILHAGR
jgi:hypothetical protein